MTQSAAIEKGLSHDEGKTSAGMKDRAADAIEKGKATAQDASTEASLQAQIAAERANDEMRKLSETGTNFVRENPGAAVVGAVGVGILLGLALRGRD